MIIVVRPVERRPLLGFSHCTWLCSNADSANTNHSPSSSLHKERRGYVLSLVKNILLVPASSRNTNQRFLIFHSLIDMGGFLLRSCDSFVLTSTITKPEASTTGQESDSSVAFVSSTSDMPHRYQTRNQSKSFSLASIFARLCIRVHTITMNTSPTGIPRLKSESEQKRSMPLYRSSRVPTFSPRLTPSAAPGSSSAHVRSFIVSERSRSLGEKVVHPNRMQL